MKIFKEEIFIAKVDPAGGIKILPWGQFYRNSYSSAIDKDIRSFILKEDVDKLGSNIKYVKTLSKGDKLYIPSYVDFSRQRIRYYGSDNNISIVRSPKSATKVVCNSYAIKERIDQLRDLYAQDFTLIDGKFVNLDYLAVPVREEINSKHKSYTVYTLANKYHDVFLDFVEEISEYREVIDPDVLHNIICKDNVITYEQYESMRELFLSKDYSLHDIAISSIFSSNIDKSIFYIGLLLAEFYRDKMMYSKQFQSVNVKPVFENIMKRYFDANTHYFSSCYSFNVLRHGKEILQKLNRTIPSIYINKELYNSIIQYIYKEVKETIDSDFEMLSVDVVTIKQSFSNKIVYE